MLPWTELRFNPVKPPPGVLPRRWVQVFNEILGHATALLSGSKNYLLIALLGRSPAGETVRACGASRRSGLRLSAPRSQAREDTEGAVLPRASARPLAETPPARSSSGRRFAPSNVLVRRLTRTSHDVGCRPRSARTGRPARARTGWHNELCGGACEKRARGHRGSTAPSGPRSLRSRGRWKTLRVFLRPNSERASAASDEQHSRLGRNEARCGAVRSRCLASS